MKRFPGLQRIAVGNPNICDYRVLDSESTLILGVAPGTTNLLVWSRDGFDEFPVKVVERKPDLGLLQDQLGVQEVQLAWVGNTLVARGTLADPGVARCVADVLSNEWPSVVTMFREPGPESSLTVDDFLEALPFPNVQTTKVGNVTILLGSVQTQQELEDLNQIQSMIEQDTLNLVRVNTANSENESDLPTRPSPQEIQRLLDMPGVKVRSVGDYLVIEGTVSDEITAGAIENLVSQWSPIVSLLRTPEVHQAHQDDSPDGTDKLKLPMRIVSHLQDRQQTNSAIAIPRTEPELCETIDAEDGYGDSVGFLETASMEGTIEDSVQTLPARETDEMPVQLPGPDQWAVDLKDELNKALKGDSIEVWPVNDGLVVGGTVTSSREEQIALRIADLYPCRTVSALRVQEPVDAEPTDQSEANVPLPQPESSSESLLTPKLSGVNNLETLFRPIPPENRTPPSVPGDEGGLQDLKKDRIASGFNETLLVSGTENLITDEDLAELSRLIGVPSLLVSNVNESIVIDGTGSQKDIERASKLAHLFGDHVVVVASGLESNSHSGEKEDSGNVGTICRESSVPILIPVPVKTETPEESKPSPPAVVRTRVEILELDEETGRRLQNQLRGDASNGFEATVVSENFTVTLDSLISQGRARTVSRPTIIALEGENAVLLTGGEIPVPTGGPQGGDIEWREYGVKLTSNASVIGDEAILNLYAEVSDLDWVNGIKNGESVIPAVKTRRLSTRVRVRRGETVFLGGLILTKNDRHLKKLPFLGDLPLLGTLFRSEEVELTTSDLAIFLAPEWE